VNRKEEGRKWRNLIFPPPVKKGEEKEKTVRGDSTFSLTFDQIEKRKETRVYPYLLKI